MRPLLPILLVVAPACGLDEPYGPDAGDSTSQTEQAIASEMGRFEVAIDVPWRVEPRTYTGTAPIDPAECFDVDCTVRYPAIPIQITIHDADQVSEPGRPRFGAFRSVQVIETSGNRTFTHSFGIESLREIEFQSDAWPCPDQPGDPAPPGWTPDHRVCKRWENAGCGPEFAWIDDKNEWHATLFYRPHTQTPGSIVLLDVTATIERIDDVSQPRPDLQIINHFRVRLGDAALPRFSDGWAYGDLHYHSQGTDNDGESAYAYRAVVQAMAALGLDFVLASDHASASRQITDIEFPDLEYWPPIDDSECRALRDMSTDRYRHLHDWIYEPGGANRQVTQVFPWKDWGMTAVPQVLLGGEVDVTPVLGVEDIGPDGMPYGNGKRYRWQDACDDVPYEVSGGPWEWSCDDFYAYDLEGHVIGLDPDRVHQGLREPHGPGRWKLKDPQGLELAYARQHVLHLPSAPDRDGFVASNTSTYGGATRTLESVLAEHRTDFVFLAHPNTAAGGAGMSRLGPDIVPYTRTELEEAFRSPKVLGLQLWNEDAKLMVPMGLAGTSDVDWAELGIDSEIELDWWDHTTWGWYHRVTPASGLHHGTASWDQMLLWGLDPGKTSGLSWLPAGQPRRVFMAGGSDSHGDFNYRRQGATDGTSEVDDTAIGKPRNLVYAGAPAGDGGAWTHEQIAGGLASGQFAVTDGPALRVAIDVNRNGMIDDGDVPMGGVRSVTRGERIPIVVEWMSTAEFGRATKIELYVGVHADALGKGMVYAPQEHGVRTPTDPQTGPVTWHLDPWTGIYVAQGTDHYWSNGFNLRWNNPATSFGVINRVSREIDPAFLPVVDIDCTGNVARKELANRIYVRAFLETVQDPPPGRAADPLREESIPRWAFSNPVWATTGAPQLTPLPPPSGTYELPPAPAFEPTSSQESVRIGGVQGRWFDRGYLSKCVDGSTHVGYNDPLRSSYAIWVRAWDVGWQSQYATPVSPDPGSLVDGGKYAHFTNGASIYFNPHAYGFGCAYYVGWGIRAAWFQTGYEWGTLGYPITDERYYDGGAYQYFDKGAAFWKPSLGTVVLEGAIAKRHLELMRAGFRAFPTVAGTNQARFENGDAIYAKTAAAAYLVKAPMLARLEQNTWLGYPLGDQVTGPDGVVYQRFENGTLFAEGSAPVCVQGGPTNLDFITLPDRPAQ